MPAANGILPSAAVCSASSLTACEKFVPRPLSTDSISPATSSGILTDVTAVPPPASKPASTGPRGDVPLEHDLEGEAPHRAGGVDADAPQRVLE